MASYEKLPSGWSVRFRVKDINTGKYIQKRLSGYDSKRKAELGYLQFVKTVGTVVKPKNTLSFESVFQEFLKYKKARIRESTYRITLNFCTHFYNFFKDKNLNELTKKDILKWLNTLSDTDYSIKYKNIIISSFKAFYKFAHDFYGVENIGSICPSFPKEIKKPPVVWNKQQFEEFLTVVDNNVHRAFFNTLFYSGARRGEILALTKSDIKDNYINIDKSYSALTKKITPTKNQSSVRKVIMPKEVIDELLALDDSMFGSMHTTSYDCFRNYQKKVKLPRMSLHGFRHSHASILIANGVDVVTVSKRLGHSNTQQTLNTYAHLIKNNDDKILDILAKI